MVFPRNDPDDELQRIRADNERLLEQIALLEAAHQNIAARNQAVPDAPAPPPVVGRVAVKLPTFWADKPSLWFAQADSQFVLANITTEITKFHYVASQLDSRAAAEVEDIITNPPADNPYTTLRSKLIERLSLSEEQRVRNLLSDEELGDRKPSQFLRHLRSLAGITPVNDNLLRQLWLRRLPPNIQAILAGQADAQLEKITELADKVAEVCPTPIAVNAVSTPPSNDLLLSEISNLSRKISEISRFSRNRSSSRRRSSRHFSRSRSPSPRQGNNLCWYHAKFQNRAKKCIPPCDFSENERSNL
uniref:DUF7041 domain-containing protein n=1 Tax=Trichogramma kaykai TaxID=54128 RepID=A0ABD2WDF2_9HYME